ncbi:hypothetical protein CEE69_23520 [Rhodopirellula bahusiensis]|uniref:Uncharacterized protein n=1 Tax=Rhodopirellula bahusiensis TaxID=2014065 RepID=A0A2G1W1S7_9BACT|nr:hypothetical protein CEE69_23520 [Rhodopirellula bahusiensis]
MYQGLGPLPKSQGVPNAKRKNHVARPVERGSGYHWPNDFKQSAACVLSLDPDHACSGFGIAAV